MGTTRSAWMREPASRPSRRNCDGPRFRATLRCQPGNRITTEAARRVDLNPIGVGGHLAPLTILLRGGNVTVVTDAFSNVVLHPFYRCRPATKGKVSLTRSRVGLASARMAGMVDRPRRGRRSTSRVPTESVEFAAALACRNSCRRAESKSVALRPTLLFLVALTRWRIWNFRQAPTRVDLHFARTLGWRGAISHRNLPRTFQPGFRCLDRDGVRWLYWVARLPARHRSHSFNCIVAAAARSCQSSNAVRPRTRAVMTGGHPERSAGSTGAVGREFARRVLCSSPGNFEQKDHERLPKLCWTGPRASSRAADDRIFSGN
jgi:hypothetical protein